MPQSVGAKFLRAWERPSTAYYVNYWLGLGGGGGKKVFILKEKGLNPSLISGGGFLHLKFGF